MSSLRQRDEDLHVADGEEAGLAVHHALVPVLVEAVGEDDDIPLLKSQLAFALRLKVVQGATARLVQHLRLWLNRKQPAVTSMLLETRSTRLTSLHEHLNKNYFHRCIMELGENVNLLLRLILWLSRTSVEKNQIK